MAKRTRRIQSLLVTCAALCVLASASAARAAGNPAFQFGTTNAANAGTLTLIVAWQSSGVSFQNQFEVAVAQGDTPATVQTNALSAVSSLGAFTFVAKSTPAGRPAISGTPSAGIVPIGCSLLSAMPGGASGTLGGLSAGVWNDPAPRANLFVDITGRTGGTGNAGDTATLRLSSSPDGSSGVNTFTVNCAGATPAIAEQALVNAINNAGHGYSAQLVSDPLHVEAQLVQISGADTTFGAPIEMDALGGAAPGLAGYSEEVFVSVLPTPAAPPVTLAALLLVLALAGAWSLKRGNGGAGLRSPSA